MKRFLCVLCALAVGAGAFAQKGKFGLDFSWGVGLGFQNIGYTFDNAVARAVLPEGKLKRTDLLLPAVKISSYNFFLLDDMLGLHASLSFSPIGLSMGEKIVADGRTYKADGRFMEVQDVLWGFEFLIGPSFGIDLNESVRFQTGLDFHLLFTREYLGDWSNGINEHREAFVSYGLGLTPQLRFSPAKRISFILGCDFIFDFGVSTDYKYFDTENMRIELSDYTVDNYFRFGLNPYLGFGINF